MNGEEVQECDSRVLSCLITGAFPSSKAIRLDFPVAAAPETNNLVIFIVT